MTVQLIFEKKIFLIYFIDEKCEPKLLGYPKRGRQITETSPRRNGINFASPSMSIDWSTVLTHFPLLDDDKERVVSWKEPDSRAKGGDASGPFRILSLANSADAEGALAPAGRVYLAGSPFINLAVFEPQAVKYDNRCESDGEPPRKRR